MKLVEIINEMTQNNINVSLKDDHVGVTYKNKRVPIFSISKKRNKFTFKPTAEWDSDPITVDAKSAEAAFSKLKSDIEGKVYSAFGGANANAKRVGKKLGLTG